MLVSAGNADGKVSNRMVGDADRTSASFDAEIRRWVSNRLQRAHQSRSPFRRRQQPTEDKHFNVIREITKVEYGRREHIECRFDEMTVVFELE